MSMKALTKAIIYILDTFSIFNYIFGLVGNALCIKVFYKQSSQTKPYLYQLAIILNDTVNCIVHIIYRYIFYHKNPWSLQLRGGIPHFDWRAHLRKNYILVWLAGGPTTFIIYIFSMAAPILLIACTYDRLYAVKRPMDYRTLKHKRRLGFIILFAVLVPCLLTWPRLVRFDTVNDGKLQKPPELENETFYRGKVPKWWGQWPVWVGLSSMALGYTIGMMAVLIVVMGLYAHYYRETYAEMDENNNATEMTHHKTLTAMIFCQFVLVLIPNVLTIVVWLGDTWLAEWLDDTPVHYLLKQFNNLFKGIQMNWNFLPYVLISANFRKKVAQTFGLKPVTVMPQKTDHN